MEYLWWLVRPPVRLGPQAAQAITTAVAGVVVQVVVVDLVQEAAVTAHK